jgi:hypothetical protein
MQARKLFVNTVARTITDAEPSALGGSGSLAAFKEDVEPIELYFYKPSGTFGDQFQYLSYSAADVKLAVGVTAPAALQTSWTPATTTITASVTATQTGGGGNNALQTVNFSPSPSEGSYSIRFPARAITIASVASNRFTTSAPHGLVDGQQVVLSAFTTPTGFANDDVVFVVGAAPQSFRVAFSPLGTPLAITASGGGTATTQALTTPLIAAQASQQNIQAAIDATGLVAEAGRPQVVVDGEGASFALRYAGRLANINVPVAEIVDSSLAAVPHLTANLSFDTTEVAALLTAGLGDSCRLEVEATESGLRQTAQMPATIAADIISSSSPAPLPAITPATSFNLIAPDASVWNVTIDDNGVLTATKV